MQNYSNYLIQMKSIAKSLNDLTFTDYYYRLMLLARSLYKWDNLPNGISEKWIERFLFNEGKCVFFKHPDLGFMVTKIADNGQLNPYDEPTLITAHATNMDNVLLKNYVEGVIISNNDDNIPTTMTLQLYALRLAEISRTIDVNIGAQKTPNLILCSDKQLMTMKNVYKQYNGNEPVIYGNKDLDIDSIRVLKTDAPIVFDKLQLHKHAVWNECMTFLGLGNANQDKKERLVTDEVQANNEQIEASANIMLKARQEACDKINKLFGLNIKVSLRNIQTPSVEEFEKGGVNNAS